MGRSKIARTGLQKHVSELAMLYSVPVALVCAPAPAVAGEGARVVWKSEEGILDRYRAAAIAVPPDTRARHTHRSYHEAELGKERAKLARARPTALPDWDPALNDMTVGEAREVLHDSTYACIPSTLVMPLAFLR